MKQKQVFYLVDNSFWDKSNSYYNQNKIYSDIMSIFKVPDSVNETKVLDIDDIVSNSNKDSETVRNILSVLVLRNFLNIDNV